MATITNTIAIGTKKISVGFRRSVADKEVIAQAKGKPTITVYRMGKKFGAAVETDKGERTVVSSHPAKAFGKAVAKFWH